MTRTNVSGVLALTGAFIIFAGMALRLDALVPLGAIFWLVASKS